MQADGEVGPVEHRTVLASDGLRLAVEDAGPRGHSGRKPLFCLAGLTRTKRDFYALRDHFAFHSEQPRRVVLMDTRGRGASDHAPDASHYTVQQEADDAAQVACAVGLGATVTVGTSRGGILAMVLALTRPILVAGSVLNDIGPRIAGAGLARLKQQLPSSTVPASWEEAETMLRTAMGAQFTAFGDEDWAHYARETFAEKDGRPARAFDEKILEPLSALPEGLPFIDLGGPFSALVKRPTLMLHGENSDLLTPDILQAAQALGAASYTVKAEGHAPRLHGETLQAIEQFLESNDL